MDSCLLSPIKYIISPVNKNIIIAEKIKFQNGVKKQILIVEENNRHKTNTATERKKNLIKEITYLKTVLYMRLPK